MLTPRTTQRGFTLIELMVSLVLSLLVAAAVTALVIAVIHSNRQTLQSTRLNQELRATLNLVANDLRRARSVADPLTAAMAPNTFRDIRNPNANCVNYGYQRMDGGEEWHTLAVSNRQLRMLRETARPGTVSCTLTTSPKLNSDQVEITEIRFERFPAGATDDFVRQINVTVTGRLVDSDARLTATQRTMSQTVYVRSVGTGI
jgi:prepilin-type N-terminal cleavage/methylation domain-containing protein